MFHVMVYNQDQDLIYSGRNLVLAWVVLSKMKETYRVRVQIVGRAYEYNVSPIILA
jgi:hypothetical protein